MVFLCRIIILMVMASLLPPAISGPLAPSCKEIIYPFINSPLKLLKNHLHSFDLKDTVKYFSSSERKKHTVSISSEGRFVDQEGKPFSTKNAQVIVDEEIISTGLAIFVLSKEGELIISNFAKKGEVHHSSLVAGDDVWFAGEIKIEDGVLLEINNYSGHYRTHERYLEKLINYLKSKNVPLGDYTTRGYDERVTYTFGK